MTNTQDQPKNKFLQPGRVKVIQGSILSPHNAGLRFVLNVANMAGKAESPLFPIFEKKWPKVKQETKGWYNTRDGKYRLGSIASVSVQSDTWVINLLTQDEELTTQPEALKTCLKEVCKMALYERASVHISSLLVDAIPELQELVSTELVDKGISVSYYEETSNG